MAIKNELTPTKRAIIDINRTCQAKCIFCYHRFTTFDAPEGKANYFSLPWRTVKKAIDDAVARGNTSIDFTGGEPTLWLDTKENKKFVDVIKYCVQVGLWPCVISNGLSPEDTYYELISLGCKEFLFSIHHTNDKLDEISQVKGHWNKLSTLIKNISGLQGVMWRANCCINSHNYKELKDIVIWAHENNCKIINFININPPYETDLPHLKELQVPVSNSAPFLMTALTEARQRNLWANVRYYPMCPLSMGERFEKYICNHPQVMFDPFEWDYGAYPKTPEHYLEYGRNSFQYQSNSQEGKCGMCGLRNVCGGVNLGYLKAHGDEELKPYEQMSDHPFYFHRKRLNTDIVIPAYKMKPEISQLLNEIPFKTQPPYTLHIIDKEQCAAANRNEGLKGDGEYVIMCDDDIVNLPDGWNDKLRRMLAENPDVIAISARLLDKNGKVGVNSANNFDLSKSCVEVNMIPTACCIFRRKDICTDGEQDIEFCEEFRGSGWEDTDFFDQLIVKFPGKKILITNEIRVTHLNEEKNNSPYFDYNKQLYERRATERRCKKIT